MNLRYLGDALDHWKGSLFEFLRANNALDNFAVDPVATDLPDWREDDFALFARLLRVPRDRILTHRFPARERQRYFGEIKHKGDIFLDPDVGVATGRVRIRERYVYPEDVWRLLTSGLNRLVIVYQHVRGARTVARVDRVIGRMGGSGLLSWCSYESGTVAMVFLSLAPHRIRDINNAFRTMLGAHGNGRIRCGIVNGAA